MFQKRVYFPNNCKNELFKIFSLPDTGLYIGEALPSCCHASPYIMLLSFYRCHSGEHFPLDGLEEGAAAC